MRYALILGCLSGLAAEMPTKGEVQEIFNDIGKIA